ncbi:KIF1-binding protein [Cyphomyrmex costatus]|uniref:KIF-binding protein n=1 Tax=Cyphomyrmex costatus TaxID=456900 RepID=A0A195CQD0_9HYME|nr:KIF1-binding protein [Cyphomyrmex costatus]
MIHSKENIPRNILTAIFYLNAGILHKKRDITFTVKCYDKCIDLLEGYELTSEGIIPAICVNEEYGLICAQQENYKCAKKFLHKAEILYDTFTNDVKLDPVVTPIIGVKKIQGIRCDENILEKLHISTLYSLAKICRTLIDKYSPACTSKNIQSKHLKIYGDWAIIVAKISSHYTEEDKFLQARYHLAVSSYILKKYLKTLKAKGITETRENITAEYEHYGKTVANVAKYWVQYGITLLYTSQMRLGLVSELKSISNKITDKYLLDFNSAKVVFRNVWKWVKKVKKYYTLENYPLEYVYNVIDFSEAYKQLALFKCQAKRVKMHERHVEMLEEVIKRFCMKDRVCPRDYRIVCRQIWMDLAEAYSAMVNLMEMRVLTSKEKGLLSKFENLAKSSIKHYQSYLNSLEMSKSQNGVVSFSDDVLNRALSVYHKIGKLYNKINKITLDLPKKMRYVMNSIDTYTFIINYCNDHPEKQKELEKYKWLKLSNESVASLSSELVKIMTKHNTKKN